MKLFGLIVGLFQKPKVGFFSVTNGRLGQVGKLGTRFGVTKCAGECTCRCCK